MVSNPCLSILVLTEDGAQDSHDTLATLIKKMAQIIASGCQTHRILFEPQNARAREAMLCDYWKSTTERDRPKLVDLGRAIAAKVLEGEECPGFVLFHFDGDRPWAQRSTSENLEKFEVFVRNFVEPSIDMALRRQQATQGKNEDLQPLKQAALARLRKLVPFYSIEAWLYQNTLEARRICEIDCGRHRDTLLAWQADRGLLDEIEKPKDQLCLGSRHNLTLAVTGFPTEAVFAVDKSFAGAVTGLLECTELCEALARTGI